MALRLPEDILALFLLLISVLRAAISQQTTDNTTGTVLLLTLLPYPDVDGSSLKPYWDGGLAVLPAAKLAVEHINQDKSILPGYQVELINANGGCNILDRTLSSFFGYVLYNKQPLAGIIGPGCTDSSMAVSSLSSRPEIALPNVHLGTSPLLEDRNRYRYAYGIISSSFTFVQTAIALAEHNKWEDVAVLYDSDTLVHFNQQLRSVVSLKLERNRITFFSVVYDTFFPHDELMRSSTKVVITYTSLNRTLKSLCIAHKRGMVFPYYQWVFSNFNLYELPDVARSYISFQYNGKFYNCTNKEILQDHLFMNFRLNNIDKREQLVSGYTYKDILQQYFQQVDSYNRESNSFSISPNIWATTTYDAVWALVLALNMSTITFNNSVNINSLQLGNRVFADKMKHSLDNIKFRGISGDISFDSTTGFTHRPVDIFHINKTMDANLVGFFSQGKLTISTGNFDIFINTTHNVIIETVQVPVALLFLLLILGLFLATVSLHIISILKRRHPSIKASSLTLNHFIFSGCYVWTTASIIYIIYLKTISYENANDYANCCHAVWVWLIPVGWTLIFGTLIAKTWRIYRIFVHFRNPGQLITNQILITIVFIQLGFDVGLGTAWSIVSPAHLEKITKDITSDQSNTVTYITQRSCVFIDKSGNRHLFWLLILNMYKGLQIVLLLTLTLLTRNITNKTFSTFLLRKGSYVSFILFILIVPLYIVLWYVNAEIHADFVLMCTLISAIMLICFTFVLLPPVLPVLKPMCVPLLTRIHL